VLVLGGVLVLAPSTLCNVLSSGQAYSCPNNARSSLSLRYIFETVSGILPKGHTVKLVRLNMSSE
jgi:hypothetical protein